MSTPPTPDLPAEAAARVTCAVHVIDLDLTALGLPEMTIDTAIGPAAVTPVGVRLSFEDDDDTATSVRINGRTGGLYLDYYHLAEGYRWPAWLTGLVEEHRPANRAAVRTAALTEAADAVLLDTAHIRYGSATDYAERHATLLRGLAVAPTATAPTPQES